MLQILENRQISVFPQSHREDATYISHVSLLTLQLLLMWLPNIHIPDPTLRQLYFFLVPY